MNSLMVAILIGICTALFKKSEKKGKESNRSYPEKRNTTKYLQDKQSMKNETTNTPPVPMIQIKTDLPAPSVPTILKTVEVDDQSSISFEKKAIVDAFIWSEILGPPRAKSSHFAAKRKD